MLEYLTTPLLLSVGACIVAAGTGGAFPPDRWYERLEKPWWNPPNWVFPLAWTVFYVAIGRAGWLLMVAEGSLTLAAQIGWWVQIVLNALFSPVFFGLKNLKAAEIFAWALAASAIVCGVLAFVVETEAGVLMTIYSTWTVFAALLARSVRRRNPQ